ncbi:MAG: DNA repair protein RadC [Candidatus Marinimicrobia bacterium]|jgi:DNA repair protein RadC|nr:DNA repair protein RadC [Candidatus Neomarinimicrobiota bacterium]
MSPHKNQSWGTNISELSDSDIQEEFVKRFTIQGGEHINGARTAADHFRGFFADAAKKEKFVICFLNSQHEVLSTEVLFEGGLDTSAVYPRQVIERVLDLGAGAVMISHNHPSGSTTPSSSDRAVTKKLETALSAIDVDLLDHIIIGGLDYFSFSNHHLI